MFTDGQTYCNFDEIKCVSYYKENITDHVNNNCECYRNCADTKYLLYSKRRVKVIQEPSLRIEMIHSKLRLKREVLYGFVECLGKYSSIATKTKN